jgi:hypothetical protein
MTLALALITVLTLCALVLRERDRDRTINRLIDAHNLERAQTTKTVDRERQLLLNRIKPETAQYIPDDGPVLAPKAVNPELDSSYWAAQETVSKEQLAELAWQQELAER